MTFTYEKTVHFGDTDAAGVVFFANFPVFCHEAYEEALFSCGINLKDFFADTGTVVPIAKCEAEYLRPLQCGDKVRIAVTPRRLGEDSFEVRYVMERGGPSAKVVARVRTEHVCIFSGKRGRSPLPAALAAWVDAP